MPTLQPLFEPPLSNRILSSLGEAVTGRLAPDLDSVELRPDQVLCESGIRCHQVYFPTTAIVSLRYVLADGASTEIAVVGNEGLVGVAHFMGGGSTPSRAVVQHGGSALRLSARAVLREFERGHELQHTLLLYTQILITQMAQSAVCNRHHSVDQALCRWLLLRLDRIGSLQIPVTQERIAEMLGVRRKGVTQAAGRLQASGLVVYRRGLITVLDRRGLEAQCCECYLIVKRESDRLLPLAVCSRTAATPATASDRALPSPGSAAACLLAPAPRHPQLGC